MGRLKNLPSALQKRPLLRAFLWGLAAATALPPVHLLPVLLLSIPAFLRLIDAAPNWKQAALTGWMYGFGLALAGLYWVTEPLFTQIASFWWLVPFAAPALATAVACYMILPALAAWLMPAGLGRVLVFAGVWVLANLAQQFLFTGFPWNVWGTDWAIPGSLGNIFLQPASLVGVYGLALFTVLLACTPLFGTRGLIALLCGLGIWGGYGLHRLQNPHPNTSLTIAMLQPDFPVPTDYSRAGLEASWVQLLNMSQAAVNNGANAVIWPESSSPWMLASDPVAREQLAQVTGTTPIIAGGIRQSGFNDYHNSIIVTAGPQPALAYYDKWKLVPFGEYTPKWIPLALVPRVIQGGFIPGPGPKTIANIPGLPPFAPVICYEAIFSGEIINKHQRPDWIADVTDDAWFGNSAGPRQDFTAIRLRAVEEGLPVARSANSGISAMIDPFGRVLASLPMDYKGVLIAPLPRPLPPTVYAEAGLYIPLGMAILCLFLGWGWVRVRQTPSRKRRA